MIDPQVKADRLWKEKLAKEKEEAELRMKEMMKQERERLRKERERLEAERLEALVWRVHGWSGQSGRIYNIARPDSVAILKQLGNGQVLRAAGEKCIVEHFASGRPRSLVQITSIWKAGGGYEADLRVLRSA